MLIVIITATLRYEIRGILQNSWYHGSNVLQQHVELKVLLYHNQSVTSSLLALISVMVPTHLENLEYSWNFMLDLEFSVW